jgi:hypothetical protein
MIALMDGRIFSSAEEVQRPLIFSSAEEVQRP